VLARSEPWEAAARVFRDPVERSEEGMATKASEGSLKHPGPRRVLALIKHMETSINRMKMIPATSLRRNAVLLGLISKSLTLGRAICLLVEKGFFTEAFGLSRTMIEIFFCVRYIGNQDSENRANTYVDYNARVRQEWSTLTKKFYPTHPAASYELDRDTVERARKFKSKGSWTGHARQLQKMVEEPDAHEEENPVLRDFDYEFTYFWTSHFVHGTVEGLDGHGPKIGQPFRVRAHRHMEKRYARLALLNVVTSLTKIFISAFRAMNEEQSEEAHRAYEMLKEF